MGCSVNETLHYVIFLARHVQRGDIPRGTKTLLIELGFLPGSEGFVHTKKAICLKSENDDLRLNTIYTLVGESYDPKCEERQIYGGIRRAIDTAWAIRDQKKWGHFFTEDRVWDNYKPSNADFVFTLGCIMDLWAHCKEEAYDEIK